MNALAELLKDLTGDVKDRIEETERKVLIVIAASAFAAGFIGAWLGARAGRR